MATEERDEMDRAGRGDVVDEVKKGAAGALANGVTGTNMGGQVMGTMGAVVAGDLAARDIVDEEVNRVRDPDSDAGTPDTFAGEGRQPRNSVDLSDRDPGDEA